MFRHILIATDGSASSAKGVKAGIGLAKALGARVTAVHVIPPFVAAYERTAKALLADARREARKAGVRCATVCVTDPQPWGGILRVAHSKRCDAIAMSSRGRGALSGLLLGSETQRVLARSKIPVLVTR